MNSINRIYISIQCTTAQFFLRSAEQNNVVCEEISTEISTALQSPFFTQDFELHVLGELSKNYVESI